MEEKPTGSELKKKTRPKLKKTANVDEVVKKKKKSTKPSTAKSETNTETSDKDALQQEPEKREEKPVVEEKTEVLQEQDDKNISDQKNILPEDKLLESSNDDEGTVSVKLKPLKYLEDEPLSIDDWLGSSENKTDEDKEVENILKSEKSAEDPLVTEAPVLKHESDNNVTQETEQGYFEKEKDPDDISPTDENMLSVENPNPVTSHASSITAESDDTYAESNVDQYLDKEDVSKASTADISTVQEKPVEVSVSKPGTSKDADNKRKFSSTSEITKSTLSLFRRMKNSKFKRPTFKIPTFKKLGVSKKSRLETKPPSIKKEDPNIVPIKRKSESPVYIHIPLNPTPEQIAKEKEEEVKKRAQTEEKRAKIVTPPEKRKGKQTQPTISKISLQKMAQKWKMAGKASLAKKKSPKSVLKTPRKSSSPPKRASPLSKKRDSPVEYIYIPLKAPEDELNLKKNSDNMTEKPAITRKYIKQHDEEKEAKIVTVGKPLKTSFKKKIVIKPLAHKKDDQKTYLVSHSPSVKKRIHSAKEDIDVAIKEIHVPVKKEEQTDDESEAAKHGEADFTEEKIADTEEKVEITDDSKELDSVDTQKQKEDDTDIKTNDSTEVQKLEKSCQSGEKGKVQKEKLTRQKSFKESVTETGKKIKQSSVKLTKDIKDLATKVKENTFSSSVKRSAKIKHEDVIEETKDEESSMKKELDEKVTKENVVVSDDSTNNESKTNDQENKLDNLTDEVEAQVEILEDKNNEDENLAEPDKDGKEEIQSAPVKSTDVPPKKVKKERKKRKFKNESKFKLKTKEISDDLKTLASKLKIKQAKESKKPTSKLLRKHQKSSFRSVSSTGTRSRSRSARISACSSDKENSPTQTRKEDELPPDVNASLQEAARKLQRIISKPGTEPSSPVPTQQEINFDELVKTEEFEEVDEKEKKQTGKSNKKSKRTASPFDSLKRTKELGKKSIQKIKEVITHKDKTHKIETSKTDTEGREKQETVSVKSENIDNKTQNDDSALDSNAEKLPSKIKQAEEENINEKITKAETQHKPVLQVLENNQEQTEPVMVEKVPRVKKARKKSTEKKYEVTEKKISAEENIEKVSSKEDIHHYEPISKEDEEDGLKTAIIHQKDTSAKKEDTTETAIKPTLKVRDSPKLEKKVSFKVKTQSQDSDNGLKDKSSEENGIKLPGEADSTAATPAIPDNNWLNIR